MAKYIDATKLCKTISNNIDYSVVSEDFYNGVMYALKEIRKAKRVDVDKVVRCVAKNVRCKDCKYSRELNEHEQVYLVKEVLICEHPEVSEDCWASVWPDHWCSYGERRVDNG